MQAVASATPSMMPSQIAPAPSVPTTKTGSNAWIISEETSMNRLTRPSAQTPGGNAARFTTILEIPGFEASQGVLIPVQQFQLRS